MKVGDAIRDSGISLPKVSSPLTCHILSAKRVSLPESDSRVASVSFRSVMALVNLNL